MSYLYNGREVESAQSESCTHGISTLGTCTACDAVARSAYDRRCPHGTPEGIPCPRCMGPDNPWGTLGFDASLPRVPDIRERAALSQQDEHAYIHDMMGDASALADRMEYDPTALEGIIGRLVNAVGLLSDQNKALAARVAALEAR
jgi:hypothetical protein